MFQILRRAMFVACVFVCANSAFAQTGSVRGTIIDEATQESLASATVTLTPGSVAPPAEASSRIGAITARNGTYTISNVAPGPYMLRVRYIGYILVDQKVTVDAGKETVVNVSLRRDVINRSVVVVTSPASRTSKSIAEIAVARIDAGEVLERNSYQDITQLLAGRIPGVRVAPTTGNVGGGTRFDVRSGGGLFGSGQPTIYLDGVRINNDDIGQFYVGGQSTSALFDINPEDIATIDVLKGPSSGAFYGTGGSNGVVLMSSRGSKLTPGAPLSVNYKGTIGFNEQRYTYTADDFLSFKDINDVFRTGNYSQHSVTLGEASNLFGYSLSFGSRDEDGILNNSHGGRESVHLSIEAYPENLYLRGSVFYSGSNVRRPPNDNYILGWLGNTMIFGPGVDSLGSAVSNSYVFASRGAIDSMSNITQNHRLIGSFEVEYKPITDLRLQGVIGFDGIDITEEDMFPAGSDYSSIGLSQGQRSVDAKTINQYNVDLNASYRYQVSEGLGATSVIGMQLFESGSSEFFFTKSGFSTDLVTNIGAAEIFVLGDEGKTSRREAGIYAQQEFRYNDTWFVSFGARQDHASSFGDAAPNIFYPRASGAIRLDKLDIFPKVINFAKFRLAYGESGQLPGASEGDIRRWGAAESGFGSGAVVTSIGNPTIEPERIKELEAGVEFEFDEAYGIDFTYYRQLGRNSIIGFVNAPSTGLTATSVPTNIGEIDGWGFETHIYAVPLRVKDYELRADLILNFADNEVVKLGGAPPIQLGVNAIREGLSRSAYFLPTVLGALFDTSGAYAGVLYKLDTAGNPLFEYQGTPVPVHTGSIGLEFRFLKNFHLYALGDWGLGHKLFNQTKQFAFNSGFGNNNRPKRVLEVELGLVPPDTYGDLGVSALTVGTPEYTAAANAFARLDVADESQTNWLEEADFFNIREISLRYDASDLISGAISQIKSLSIVLSAHNVFLSTKYSGADVEVSTDGARGVARGTDFLTLQSPRTYSLSIGLGF